MALGGSGVFSVVSNLFPEAVSSLCRRMREEKTEEAAGIQRAMLPLIDALFSEVNPVPVKTACSMQELCSPALRLPLAGMEEGNRLRLEKEMIRAQGLFAG